MGNIFDSLVQFWQFTGFANMTISHIIMICVGIIFITLGIVKEWEPLLLVPIGFGIIIGNIPMFPGLNIGVYEDGSVLNTLYQGVRMGWYPPLIFLGIGAMTDFSALISQPRLMLIGAAAQIGIFGAYLLSILFGFAPNEAGAIGIIGGADGPTAIFLSSKLAPDLMGAIAVSAYSYMALVPVIQKPIMLLLTTKKERLILHPHRLHRAFRPPAAGHALLRQPVEGERRDQASGGDRPRTARRCDDHPHRPYCGCFHPG